MTDWKEVEAAVEDYVTFFDSDRYYEDGIAAYESMIVEAAVNAIYGPEIWDHINEKMG